MRILLTVWMILFASCSFAETVTVSGMVIDERTNAGLPGAKIGLYELVGVWKVWKLPEKKLLNYAITDEHGAFELKADVSTVYAVESRFGGCWLPFTENFDVRKDGNKVEGLIVPTAPDLGLCKVVEPPAK